MSQIVIRRLQMNRHGVVDAAMDSATREVILKCVSVADANNVKVPHGFRVECFIRRDNPALLE